MKNGWHNCCVLTLELDFFEYHKKLKICQQKLDDLFGKPIAKITMVKL